MQSGRGPPPSPLGGKAVGQGGCGISAGVRGAGACSGVGGAAVPHDGEVGGGGEGRGEQAVGGKGVRQQLGLPSATQGQPWS